MKNPSEMLTNLQEHNFRKTLLKVTSSFILENEEMLPEHTIFQ